MKININGSIVSNSLKKEYAAGGIECFSPNDLKLPITGEEVEVYINSGGGDVYAGSEIASKLTDYKGKVTIKIVGLCASIATIIALTGDTVEMSQTALFMIHEAMTGVFGNKKKIESDLKSLDTVNEMLLKVYHKRTGLPIERLKAMMAEETWLTCEEAIELGFVDKELSSQGFSMELVASVAHALPQTIQYDYMTMIQKRFKSQVEHEKEKQTVSIHIQHMTNWLKKNEHAASGRRAADRRPRPHQLKENAGRVPGLREGEIYIEDGKTVLNISDYETYNTTAQALLKSQLRR